MPETKAQLPVDDYQAQEDVRTLVRAHQIKGDKKRHSAAKTHAKKMMASHKAIVEDAEDDPKRGGDSGADEAAEKPKKGKAY